MIDEEVGRVKLYGINKENIIVRKLIRLFNYIDAEELKAKLKEAKK